MEMNNEQAKKNWYDIFMEGMNELGIKSVLNIAEKIDDSEGDETQERVDDILQSIKELEFTTEEAIAVFEKFGKDVVTFRTHNQSLDFVKKKLERKTRLLQNRVQRSMSSGFGKYILHLRDAKNYSLKQVEAITGISPSYINRIEKGERKTPSYPIIEKLAFAYGVNVKELLKIAGVEAVNSDVQGFAQLIYANNFTVNGTMVSLNRKELIVELIEKMDASNWDENSAHLDSIEMIQIINKYKKADK